MASYREISAAYNTAKELLDCLENLSIDTQCAISLAEDCTPDKEGFCPCGITDEEIQTDFLRVETILLDAYSAVLRATIEVQNILLK